MYIILIIVRLICSFHEHRNIFILFVVSNSLLYSCFICTVTTQLMYAGAFCHKSGIHVNGWPKKKGIHVNEPKKKKETPDLNGKNFMFSLNKVLTLSRWIKNSYRRVLSLFECVISFFSLISKPNMINISLTALANWIPALYCYSSKFTITFIRNPSFSFFTYTWSNNWFYNRIKLWLWVFSYLK